MLEKHSARTPEENDRIAVVAAALEIIKASASAPSAYVGRDKLDKDAKFAADHVATLADAIQAAIKK
ncbi:hypothetical protein [Serratia fonticola]